MTITIRAAQLFLLILCVSLCYVVMTRRLKLAWAIELALMLLTIALIGALDALLSERPFLDTESVAARWLLVGSAAGIFVLFVGSRLLGWPACCHRRGPHRRVTDFAELTSPAELEAIRQRRPWHRWVKNKERRR